MKKRHLPVVGPAAPAPPSSPQRGTVSRRGFLTQAASAVAATTLLSCDLRDSSFFREHFTELTPQARERLLARIEAQTSRRFGREVHLSNPEPLDDVAFVFCINLSVCNGNRKCVEACVQENNQSRDPAIEYIKVLEMPRGTFDMEQGTADYDGKVPKPDKFYLPLQCNQCDNPPCVRACPVEATWKQSDGVVVIDYDWCIGCRYCMAACPYEARRFNYHTPRLPRTELNPDQGYFSNRPRPRGVVEKCHFCIHRTRRGALPACLEACPTGARKFGNVLDSSSEVAAILREKPAFVLREELKTLPRVFYYFE